MRSFFLIFAAIFSTSTFADNHICWFDHVSADGDRMVLHFSPNASLRLWGLGKTYLVEHGSIRESGAEGSGMIVDVALAPGQLMDGSTFPEDSCTYAATVRDGKRGLLITANNNAFGHHTTATDFLLPK